jgi:hypothetical protein
MAMLDPAARRDAAMMGIIGCTSVRPEEVDQHATGRGSHA